MGIQLNLLLIWYLPAVQKFWLTKMNSMFWHWNKFNNILLPSHFETNLKSMQEAVQNYENFDVQCVGAWLMSCQTLVLAVTKVVGSLLILATKWPLINHSRQLISQEGQFVWKMSPSDIFVWTGYICRQQWLWLGTEEDSTTGSENKQKSCIKIRCN